MKSDNILLIIAVIALLMAVVSSIVTYLSVVNLADVIIGYVTTAEANLTVETLAQINFSTALVNWGSGRVNPGSTAASLTTFPTGNVTGGNWTLLTAGGLRIENTGNVNMSLNLTGTKTAAQFIGGTGSVFQWNVTASEANSCLNRTGNGAGGLNLNTFHNVNTSIGDSLKCYVFRFEQTRDEVRIDFNLTVPEDSSTGALTDTITATAYAFNPAG